MHIMVGRKVWQLNLERVAAAPATLKEKRVKKKEKIQANCAYAIDCFQSIDC